MRITVEISLYPFTDNYVPIINDFIMRLKNHPELKVITNATSTLIYGEHTKVFDILSKETETTFASGKNVFIMKVIGFERDIDKHY